MAYADRMVASRGYGRMKWAGIGIGAYHDPRAVLAGTFATTPTEGEAITGTQTIFITLVGAAWAAAGATFNAQRQNIINGLVSRQSESTGLALLKSTLAVEDVVRTSATRVTITLPATPAYKISANETIAFDIPPTALNRRGPRATTDVNVAVVNSSPAVTAALTGTALAGGVTEAQIVTGGETVIITLTGATWIGAAGFNAVRQAIIDGMVAAASPANGWNVRIKGAAAVTTVVRTSNSAVTFTTPAAAAYSVSADETITVTIPKAAIDLVDADVVATETVVVTAA